MAPANSRVTTNVPKPPRQLLRRLKAGQAGQVPRTAASTAELASSNGDMVHGTGQDVSSTDVSLTGGTIGLGCVWLLAQACSWNSSSRILPSAV